jgi:hypothetical protein
LPGIIGNEYFINVKRRIKYHTFEKKKEQFNPRNKDIKNLIGNVDEDVTILFET